MNLKLIAERLIALDSVKQKKNGKKELPEIVIRPVRIVHSKAILLLMIPPNGQAMPVPPVKLTLPVEGVSGLLITLLL
mgnify:CR=1 FL=1